MLELLDRQQTLTLNQWKIAIAATLGDMLDFFDFFLIGFVLAFIVGDWHLTYGQSAADSVRLGHQRAVRFAVLGLDGGQDRPPQGHDRHAC